MTTLTLEMQGFADPICRAQNQDGTVQSDILTLSVYLFDQVFILLTLLECPDSNHSKKWKI